MTASRAYSLYNRASGGRKLTSVARAPLSSSVYWLAQERKVVLVRRDEIPWQDDDLVRMPDSPAVRVRELGAAPGAKAQGGWVGVAREAGRDQPTSADERAQPAGTSRGSCGFNRPSLALSWAG